ncbi:hypothetical protein [Halobellus rubicundus]|uniref:Oxidoreductase n=1 Tax=Halobellus rubicundus TaxID=2996466 RepID=A0ABD5MEG7_9EURY
MSWGPTTLYWISIALAFVWLWLGDTRDPDSVVFVVLFLKLGGGLATLLFLAQLDSASGAQIAANGLSLLAFLFVLVIFGGNIGFKNLFRGLFAWLR